MVKSRMTTADVAAEVACLRARVTGMRLANVYDDSAKVPRLAGSLSVLGFAVVGG